MIEFISEYMDFIFNLSLSRFVEIFWYFIVFDFLRYVGIELLILILHELKLMFKKEDHSDAREMMFREYPLVSVIVPGKNEGKHLGKLSKSLLRQTYKNIELIVVDDGSDDNTEKIGRKENRDGIITLFLRNDVRGGKASAANLALRYSSGKYIVHLDADSNLYFDAIEKLILPFYIYKDLGAVGGDVRVDNRHETLVSSLQGIEYGKTISIGRQVNSALGILRIISGAYGAFRKDILDRLKGWDIGPGLDGDITLKIRKMGYKVKFAHASVCYTNTPTTFRALAKQRYRWNKSTVRFRLRKHLDLIKPDANFNILNAIAVIDNIWYNLILNANWLFYMFQVTIIFPESTSFIILTNYLLYFCSNIIQFGIVLILSPNKYTRSEEMKLIPYLPLMPLYTGMFLRLVRSFAYVMELFYKRSYDDPWNPWKVSRIAKEEGM